MLAKLLQLFRGHAFEYHILQHLIASSRWVAPFAGEKVNLLLSTSRLVKMGLLLILLSTYSLSMTSHLNKVQDNHVINRPEKLPLYTKRDNLITSFKKTKILYLRFTYPIKMSRVKIVKIIQLSKAIKIWISIKKNQWLTYI